MSRVIELGFMDNGTGKHQSNTVISPYGLSPAITTLQGGTSQIKVLVEEMNDIKRLGNIYREDSGGSYAGNVYDPNGICPTINTAGGGNREPMIIIGSTQRNAFVGNGEYCPTLTTAMGEGGGQIPMITEEVWSCASRGRNIENPSDRTPGIELEQRLEVNKDGVSNCITSVAKDSYVLESEGFAARATKGVVVDEEAVAKYRVRKLTPREAFLLMNLTNEEFERAQEVASNTALYKAAGNGLIPNCIIGIIGQMIEGRGDYYKKGYQN